jgi:hypothetical protein
MGAGVDRLISWSERGGAARGHAGTVTRGHGDNTGGPEGAGFEPAKLFRSLPI